jgi:hypothetical protein
MNERYEVALANFCGPMFFFPWAAKNAAKCTAGQETDYNRSKLHFYRSYNLQYSREWRKMDIKLSLIYPTSRHVHSEYWPVVVLYCTIVEQLSTFWEKYQRVTNIRALAAVQRHLSQLLITTFWQIKNQLTNVYWNHFKYALGPGWMSHQYKLYDVIVYGTQGMTRRWDHSPTGKLISTT